MGRVYKLDEETFFKLIRCSGALMLQQLNDNEVIDNIASELSDVILEILRLTNEKESDTL